MVKFDVDDDGEFLDQQPDQGDCSSMSDDDDSLDQQTDLGDDGSMSDDDDFLDQQKGLGDDGFMSDDDDDPLGQQSDQEDDRRNITSDDDDSSLDEQWGQEAAADADNVFFTASLWGAVRSFSVRGFHTPAGAGAGDADDPEGTFSENYVFNIPRRGVPGLRRPWWPPAATDDDDAAEDEDDPFPAPAPPASASLAAIAALEAVEPPADDCCPVCLQDGAASSEGAAWKRVAACGHRFHASCVAQWLRVKLSCPVCRCPATYPAATPAAAEPPRPPLPAIVEEALTMSYEEFDVFVKSPRWLEFMATRNSPGLSAGATSD